MQGLSPQARGNLKNNNRINAEPGPIPAGAGEPGSSVSLQVIVGAYPRRRGGTAVGDVQRIAREGLSPQARGNHYAEMVKALIAGPIPAGAGEPLSMPTKKRSIRAYPRRRGGTCSQHSVVCADWGLSPQARGNPDGDEAIFSEIRPIPAGAGEPGLLVLIASQRRAYPRRRGGTADDDQDIIQGLGLSPQARGNR